MTEAVSAEEPQASSLFPRGNPVRWARGGLTTAAGSLLAFLLMAHDGHLRFGVPLGVASVSLAAFGVMDLVGSFDDGPERVVSRTTLSRLARPLASAAVALLVFALALSGAASGLARPWIWGVLVTLAFVGLVLGVFRVGVALGPWATDEKGLPRPVWQRHGFWLVIVAAVLLLPCMGSFSLWWAQDGWFWSKPVLDFWIQAIFMAALGVHYEPGEMLHGLGGRDAHPEWVVRAPIFLLSVLAVYLLYKGVSKVFGRRAGFLGGVVLLTMTDWWSLAHQTMTDMPFVGATTSAMGLMLLGLYTPEDEEVRLHEVTAGKTVWRLSTWHLVFGAILVCAIPQILYLVSRNLTLVLHGPGPHLLRAHYDEFRSGSGLGNCGQPGNEACTPGVAAMIPPDLRQNVAGLVPRVMRLFLAYEPTLQALTWSIVLVLLLFLSWGERRARRLAYLAAWFFAALATLAKGPAGFGLPILCGLAYVATTKRWRELARFELASGLLIVLLIALPWGVAMFVRHGPGFTQRLVTHDMVDRAFSHVHDTNEGDDTSFRFYVWQLGYALFPWTGLAPLGLVYSLRRSDAAAGGRGEASIFLLMWFLFAFALFSFMGTKFHHYIFPAVPPVAMLVGIALDDALGDGALLGQPTAARRGGRAAHEQLMFAAAAVAGALILAVVGRDLVIKPDGADQPGAIRLLHLYTYNYRRPWPDSVDFSVALAAFAVVGVALGLALAVRRIRSHAVVAFLGFALVWAAWGLDVYMVKLAPHWGQHELFAAYYASRSGPDEPIVAYQMNWKGENFYSGNRLATFVSSGAAMTNWLKQQREKGVHVVYFVAEHTRIGSLKGEVQPKLFREMTDKKLNNKFVLIRMEI